MRTQASFCFKRNFLLRRESWQPRFSYKVYRLGENWNSYIPKGQVQVCTGNLFPWFTENMRLSSDGLKGHLALALKWNSWLCLPSPVKCLSCHLWRTLNVVTGTAPINRIKSSFIATCTFVKKHTGFRKKVLKSIFCLRGIKLKLMVSIKVKCHQRHESKNKVYSREIECPTTLMHMHIPFSKFSDHMATKK